MFVVVLAQVLLERLGQCELADVVVGAVVVDDGAGELLQTEAVAPVDRMEQHRLEEHAAVGVFVMLQQTCGENGKHSYLVRVIEAEVLLHF